jgi:hypothetical protein
VDDIAGPNNGPKLRGRANEEPGSLPVLSRIRSRECGMLHPSLPGLRNQDKTESQKDGSLEDKA